MDQFVGEIRLFAGNFAPKDWAFCNGQLLPISQNTALFSILGTMYGGDGKTTFALPNLQGTAPMGQGQGPGLTNRVQGSKVGTSTVTLLTNQIPAHTHTPNASTAIANLPDPTNNVWGSELPSGQKPYAATANTPMNPLALSVTGGTQPHNNTQPYLALNFIIALYGIFPPRG